MKVKLISLTKPLIEGINTAEELISYCARVSNPSNQLNTETAPRLLKYCIDHQHWSIFEQAFMTVEIKTSRAIAAQILRHRSFSFQEYSQRYASANEFEDIEWRLQGKTNRQVGEEDVDLSPELKDEVDVAITTCKELYKKLIDNGLAKECARMILPLNTSTTLYMSGNIRSWLHYLQLRTKEDTQKEHRDIALEIKKIFVKQFPVTSCALNWI
jgi:thymidylate synthase (FAD)